MKTKVNVHEWKDGTDALAMCMICGGEYSAETDTCPDCNVTLSKVRRCPECNRIVSFQHTKCVYCRTPFLHDEPRRLSSAEILPEMPRAQDRTQRRLRAGAVSLVTFLVVFSLGTLFFEGTKQSSVSPHIVARSYALRSIALRHAPTSSSSTVDSVAAGATLDVLGYAEGDPTHGWILLNWKNAPAYAPAVDLAPPKILVTDGANVLKTYLLGMESTEVLDEAEKAVEYYAKSYPGNASGDELRWVLAERLRYFAQRGGSEATSLRHRANQQYELLVASNGKLADKAREVMAKSSAISSPESETRVRTHTRRPGELEVVAGSGTQTLTASSTAHEVLVLSQTDVIVRTGKIARLKTGSLLSGRVAHPVKTNGITAIPAGALCQLKVLGDDNSLGLDLTSIDIEHHTYAVKSRPVEVPSAERGTDRSLTFHLDAPLIIER